MSPRRSTSRTDHHAPVPASAKPARPAVRPSLAVLGWVLAVQPWLALPLAGQIDPTSRPRWLAGELGILAVLWLLLRERKTARHASDSAFRVPHSAILLGAAAILAGLILSALFSPATALGLRVTLREATLVMLAAGLAFAPAPSAAEWRRLAACFLGSAGLMALLALIQIAAPVLLRPFAPFLQPGGEGRAAMVGTFGNPEYLAGWLAAALAMSAALALSPAPAAARRLARWLPPTVALLALSEIFLSGGRGAALAAAGGLGLWWLIVRPGFRCGRQPPRRRWFAYAGTLAAFLVVLFAAAQLGGSALRRATLPGRLAELANPESTSLRHRVGLYLVSGRMIAAHPLLGAGPGRFGAAFNAELASRAAAEPGIGYWAFADALRGSYVGEAHCDPLQWWAEYGLLPTLGLALMLAAGLGGAAGALRRSGADPAAGAIWAAGATLALGMWVSFPLHAPARAVLWWAVLGLLGSLARPAAGAPNAPQPPTP